LLDEMMDATAPVEVPQAKDPVVASSLPHQVRDEVGDMAGPGAKAWLLGTMRASDPKAVALQNNPHLTTLWRNPLVRGVLAWDRRDLQVRILKRHLSRLGRPLAEFKETALSKVKEYGVAGVISFVVQDVVYWTFVIIPVSAYLFHNKDDTSGQWLPSMSDPDCVGEYAKLVASVYLFSKIPPIEAARWAWAISMIPWWQAALPASLTGRKEEKDDNEGGGDAGGAAKDAAADDRVPLSLRE
jgi:hypothetical protein